MGYLIAMTVMFIALGAGLALTWDLRQSAGSWEPEQFVSASAPAWKAETEREVDWCWARVDLFITVKSHGAVYRAACEAREAETVYEWFI